jgi:hypothetical protein
MLERIMKRTTNKNTIPQNEKNIFEPCLKLDDL